MLRAFCLSLFFAAQAYAAPGEISGQVTAAKGVTLGPGGALFVIAKEAGRPMPIAVLRVPTPTLPYKFTLSEKNAMVAGTKFTGPFLITARYSPSGDAMDKSGPEGSTTQPIAVGKSDVKIEMKSK